MTRCSLHPRRGYVLLLVLLLLAIVAIAMTAACRAALAQSSRAAAAQEDLQHRWGVITLRAALLNKSERILTRRPGRITQRFTLALTTQSFDLLISDEQAKLNVNSLPSSAAERTITEIIRSQGSVLPVRLAPRRAATSQSSYESLAQLFSTASVSDLCILSRNLTCFGDGLLNLRRCSFDSLRYRCGSILNINELRHLYDDSHQGLTAAEAIDHLTLPREKRDRLDAAVTDVSTCHSLWIITRTATRSWYYLAIRDESQDEGHQTFFQEW